MRGVTYCANSEHNSKPEERQDQLTCSEEKRAKAGQNPCWRCRILKKKCDAKSTCEECDMTEGRTWELGC
ncbi:uncharacterized protein K444DRAFT_183469 [Hyaloscypha bicolor E]|uniref:Zn(2)-C6 fungal-type domain-containing protein n=1 Tax=Hyaloscypha bicolor E TaxID=1095630 RepID=A0A2J6TRG0_9HELO|nr:uncharacterized protein K444DRAFT_183469 [Hyaloscypha bicolor E]PMD65604.1 hypothetical protein K444DRAFT_183469 [Hyaloscypha bicolor E]